MEAYAVEMPAGSDAEKERVRLLSQKVGVLSRKVRLLTLDSLDRRTAAFRNVADAITELEDDLGGADQISAAKRALVKDAALLGAMLADLGAKWLQGEHVDLAGFCTLANARRRALETIGLERRARDVTPTLREYLATKPAPSEERPAS